MERLPYIDGDAIALDRPAGPTWTALLQVIRRETAGGERLARLLGCDPAVGDRTFTGAVGEAVPGFRVVAATPGRELVLRGRHRFSHYQLTFLLGDGELRAQTHAAFPGLHGKAYRALVIGTRAHRLVTRRLLRRVAQRAAAAPAA